MLTIRWSLGHTHSREPASSLERLVKIPRFAPKTTCFFSWNDFIPLTINIQPDLTLQQFSLLFLFTSLSSFFFLTKRLWYNIAALFVEHLFGSVLSNYPKGYYGLSDQALQKTCYLCSRPLRDLFFVLPFFLNHTITSETVPRRKFSVSAKYYNVHACPLFFIDLIICFTFGYNSLLISVIFITACKQSPIIAGDVCHVFVVAYVCVRTNNLIVENIFMHKIDSSVTDSHLVFSDCKQRFCSD